MIKVKMKRLSEYATAPTYGSDKATCVDLYADLSNFVGRYLEEHKDDEEKNENISFEEINNIVATIGPGETYKIGTGFAFEPPEGYAGFIFARSGISVKKGLRPSNCVGVCDEDYRGEYIVPIHNDSTSTQQIQHGERIAQLVFLPYEQAEFEEVDELTDTNRGEGGFGSTGS